MQLYSDKEILDRISVSDPVKNNEAFRFIYFHHFEVIEKFIISNNGETKDAQDIFQDALIVLFHQVKEKKLALNCKLQTYLYSICRNLWLNKLKKDKRKVELSDELQNFIIMEENHFDLLIMNEQDEQLIKLVKRLGEGCQKMLRYFYFEKLKLAEIAQKLNLKSEQVAKNKRMICMKKLRALAEKLDFFKNI